MNVSREGKNEVEKNNEILKAYETFPYDGGIKL